MSTPERHLADQNQYFLDRSSPLDEEKAPHRRITPEDLLEDNNSDLAQERRREFNTRRENRTQGLIWLCDDARVWRLDPGSTYYHTIANGSSAESLNGAINSDAIMFGIVMSHGPDCGGRAARHSHVKNGQSVSRTGIDGYIGNHVHDHTKLQGVRQAIELARLTDKQVAAAYQNHQTGDLEFYAVFNRRDGKSESHLSLRTMLGKPTPGDIPPDFDFPTLANDELTEELMAYVQLREKRKKEELDRHPDLKRGLKVQKPKIIKIGDSLRSAEVWLPGLAYPGNMFRMSVPRTRERDATGRKNTVYYPRDIALLGDQLEYPIAHAVANRSNPGAPFSNSDTMIIASSDLLGGIDLAARLANRDFMPAWLEDERNQILVVENHAGVLTQATRVNFKVENGEVVAGEWEKVRKA